MTTLSKTQATLLNKLREDCKADDLSLNPPATMAAMDARYSFSSTRNALAGLLKEYPETKVFREEFDKRRPEWVKIDTSQVPTEKQEEKHVDWLQLLTWRTDNWESMNPQEQLLISLYTMMPPQRADFAQMRIVTRKPKKLADGTNYLIMGKSTMKFLFHAYKTAATFGDREIILPAALQRVVKSWVESRPGQPFLLGDGETPWQDQRLGAAVRRIFQQHHGMDTGISTLRHSYLTHYHRGSKSLAELTKLSRSMGHSITTGLAYRHISLE